MDAEGQPVMRSHYVDEVHKLLSGIPVEERELSDVVAPADRVASLRELMERAIRDGRPEMVAADESGVFAHAGTAPRWTEETS